ncbi:hypothetical protein CRG98_035155, partial [Punica granatum]
MCGIALIVSGVRLGCACPGPNAQHLVFSVDELKSALRRRGPDSLGAKKLFFNISGSADEQVIDSWIESEGDGDTRKPCCWNFVGEMHFIGATLQLRGVSPTLQPFVDEFRNILAYNGEIFGGIPVERDSNDAEILLQYLGGCCSCNSHELSGFCTISQKEQSSVPEVLSRIKGPWAIIYWQESSKTLWFGRDAFGRRSLLVHWSTVQDSRFLLSSVSPTSSVEQIPGSSKASVSGRAELVLTALKESVMRRTSLHTFFQGVTYGGRKEQLVPVAVLFSGGLDSMILAALLEQCLDPQYEVDLLNVSFDGPSAPDRISAKMGIEELRRIAPSRRWRLVEIDADLSSVTMEMKHVMSLIYPANTYMDLNIGTALWLAANGNGWVYEDSRDENEESLQRHKYKSPARIVLVGSGADEQCAGYGRHKTKFRNG